MSKAADTARQWLAELVKSANLSEAEKTALETTLQKPELLDYVGRSALRQADYDRLMNSSKSQLATKMQEIQGYEQDLANWRGKTEQQVAQIQSELGQSRAEAARIRQVAYSYNLTDEDLGAAVAPHTTPPGVDPQPGADKVTKPSEFSASQFLESPEFQQLSTMYSLLPAETADITAEHMRLFGSSPTNMREITTKALQERRPLRDVWEETYEVADKRKEIETAKVEAEITRRVDEQMVAMRSQALSGSPLPRPGGTGSYVLSQRDKLTPPEDKTSLAGDRTASVNAAVAFWNTLNHSEE